MTGLLCVVVAVLNDEDENVEHGGDEEDAEGVEVELRKQAVHEGRLVAQCLVLKEDRVAVEERKKSP